MREEEEEGREKVREEVEECSREGRRDRQGRSLHPQVGISAPDGEMNTLDRLLTWDGVKRK